MSALEIDATWKIDDDGTPRTLNADDFGRDELVAILASIGAAGDSAAANGTVSSSAVALLKAILIATQATKLDADTINLNASHIDLSTDGLETLVTATNTALAGVASQTTLAAVLAKLSSDPATATGVAAVVTKLTDGSVRVGGTVTTAGERPNTYAARTGAGDITLPAGATLHEVNVFPDATGSAVTVNIFGAGAITVPAYGRDWRGSLTASGSGSAAKVTVGGAVAYATADYHV